MGQEEAAVLRPHLDALLNDHLVGVFGGLETEEHAIMRPEPQRYVLPDSTARHPFFYSCPIYGIDKASCLKKLLARGIFPEAEQLLSCFLGKKLPLPESCLLYLGKDTGKAVLGNYSAKIKITIDINSLC